MGIKFFGQYLVENKAITREALQQAVALQRKVNLLFGATAKSMGLITDADIELVHVAQRKHDLNFGDMCVELGILTQTQMKQVAAEQKKNHLHLGDALVRTGAVRAEDLPALLDGFEADQAPYFSDTAAARTIPNVDLWDAYADLTYKMFTRVARLAFKPGQRSLVKGIEPNDALVVTDMTGDAACTFVLSVSDQARDIIAKAILQQDSIASEPTVVRLDAVKEFTNIVCGNISAKASQMGRNIETGLPEIVEVKKRFSPLRDGKGLLYPLHVSEGRVEIAIFWQG